MSYSTIITILVIPIFVFASSICSVHFQPLEPSTETQPQAAAIGVNSSSPSTTNLKDKFIRQRLTESETIFQRAIQSRVKALALFEDSFDVRERSYPKYDTRVWYADLDNGLTLWDFFPATFNCPHTKERVGDIGDGGKWICGLNQIIKSNYPCVVYSFGINYQITFETELLNRTQCKLRTFDPTISPDATHIRWLLEKYPGRVTFEPVGLGNIDGSDMTQGVPFPVQTLGTIMKRYSDEFVDILKADIEGYEFQMLNNIIRTFGNNSLPFGQLQVEFHFARFVNREDFLKTLVKWWVLLEDAGLRPFHREANLLAPTLGHRWFIEFFEFSFLNVGRDHLLLHG